MTVYMVNTRVQNWLSVSVPVIPVPVNPCRSCFDERVGLRGPDTPKGSGPRIGGHLNLDAVTIGCEFAMLFFFFFLMIQKYALSLVDYSLLWAWTYLPWEEMAHILSFHSAGFNVSTNFNAYAYYFGSISSITSNNTCTCMESI